MRNQYDPDRNLIERTFSETPGHFYGGFHYNMHLTDRANRRQFRNTGYNPGSMLADRALIHLWWGLVIVVAALFWLIRTFPDFMIPLVMQFVKMMGME